MFSRLLILDISWSKSISEGYKVGSLKYSKNCLQFPFAMRYRSSTELTQRSCNRSQDSINCPGLQNHQLTKITFSFLYRCIDIIIFIFFVFFICTRQKRRMIAFNLTTSYLYWQWHRPFHITLWRFCQFFGQCLYLPAWRGGVGVGGIADLHSTHAVFAKPNIA